MTSAIHRFADLAKGLVSLVLVLTLLVGIPALLLLVVGFPLPTEVPSAELVRAHVEDGDIPDAFVIKTLAVIVWIVWVQLALAIVVELLALIRGRMSGRAPVLPGIQTVVGKLVASIVLIGSALTPTRAAVVAPIAAPAMAVQAMVVDEVGAGPLGVASGVAEMPRVGGGGPAPIVDRAEGRSAAHGASYTTRSGDNWWDLGERLLGDGMRWSELRSLNAGRTMPDGELVTGQTETVRPGWRLAVPADADPGQLDADPADPAGGPDRVGRSPVGAPRPDVLVYEGSTGSTGSGAGPAYQVVEGDNLWDIAERHLGDPFRWPEILEASTALGQPSGLRITDPNLIWPDSILLLPADAVDVPAADPELVDAVLAGAGAATSPSTVDRGHEHGPADSSGGAAEADLRPGPTPDDLRAMAERAAEAAPSPPVAPAAPGRGGSPGPGGPGGPDGPGRGADHEWPAGARSDGSPALVPGLVAVGSGALLVATGLLGLLRRSRRLRLSETGEASIPEPPPIDLVDVETVLRQRADTTAAGRLIGAVSSLAAAAAVGEPWPTPVAVRVIGDRVEAVVADGGGPLPAPWREVAVDGGVLPPGQRAGVALIDELAGPDRAAAGGGSTGPAAIGRRSGPATGPAPVPTLASVGAGLLVNLEAVGVVAIAGVDGAGNALGRSIVHELATTVDPAGGRPPVDALVSDAVGGVELHPVVRAGPVDRLVGEAEAWLADVELALAASAVGGSWGLADVVDRAGRARALVVVVRGDEVGPGSAVAALADRARDRRVPLSVVLVGPPADPSFRPSMVVDIDDNQVRLEPLGLSARAPSFDLELIIGVEALIDHARRAPIVPRPEPTWVDDEAAAGAIAPLTPPPATLGAGPSQAPTEETPEHEIVTELPTEDDEITDRSDDDDTGLLIRVLGPVEIEGGPSALDDLSEPQRSILAFLALAGPSTRQQIARAVGPAGPDGSPRLDVDEALADLRRRLGPLFPSAGDGRHRVRSTITDLGSARRWIEQARGLSGERARNLLHLALSEVRGRPFDGVPDHLWTWIEDHQLAIATQASSLLIDACFDLCDGAYRADDVHLALWACEVASLVDPLQETAATRQVQLLTMLGRHDEADEVATGWEAAFTRVAGRPAPHGPRRAAATPPDPSGADGEVMTHAG